MADTFFTLLTVSPVDLLRKQKHKPNKFRSSTLTTMLLSLLLLPRMRQLQQHQKQRAATPWMIWQDSVHSPSVLLRTPSLLLPPLPLPLKPVPCSISTTLSPLLPQHRRTETELHQDQDHLNRHLIPPVHSSQTLLIRTPQAPVFLGTLDLLQHSLRRWEEGSISVEEDRELRHRIIRAKIQWLPETR